MNSLVLPQNGYGYLLVTINIALALRVLNSVFKVLEDGTSDDLRVKEFVTSHGSFANRVWIAFLGFKDINPDFWYNTLLGVLELLAYPVLIYSQHFDVIGWWFGIKTISQWKVWSEKRFAFNRFLLINAFVLFISFFLAERFIG
jgi:hypothetical protein